MAEEQESGPDDSKALSAQSHDTGSAASQAKAGASGIPPVKPANRAIEEAVEDAAENPREPFGKPVSYAVIPAARARSSRYILLAASIALAAALGSFAGALSASGFAHFWPAASAKSNAPEASTLAAIKAELAELSTLKANLDGATRTANSQFTKITDRLDRVEHAQIDPATKTAHIADVIDRLEKRSAAAPETTGTVTPSSPLAATEAKSSAPDKILQGWIVQDVRAGRALILSRYGGVFDVTSGNIVPGLGRVETIKREDGQWVVVTARGLITSGR